VSYIQVWGTFSNVTLEVFSPLGIVFLATLGTMCHLSLGVGKTLLSISFYLLLFVFISIKKMNCAMLLLNMS
jgi:hypothetical protein